MNTPSLRALRVALPTPLQGATPMAWQSQFHGVPMSAPTFVRSFVVQGACLQ